MTDQQIRDYVDSLAQPLSLEEVIDTRVVSRVRPMNPARRVQPWTVAAVLVAVLGLAAFVVAASRDTSSESPAGAEPAGLELTPVNPEVGTSFVATVTGDSLDDLTVRREAYIEQYIGGAWQRIWLVYPVFLGATAPPDEPVDLTVGNIPTGVSPIRLVATQPFQVTLPGQLAPGSYRFCLQVAGAEASAADDYCAPISVPNQTSAVTSVQPVGSPSIGTEEPLVEADIIDLQDVAKPGSAHAFSVEGHPPVLLWTTLMPNLQTGDVEEWQCVGEAFGSGCGSVSIPAQFGQTSSIDNRVATDDLFTWSNLPPEVDTVRYDDGVTQLWQRPVAGLAIFRVDPDHSHPDITAYDAAGAALPYSFWGQNPPLTPAAETTVEPATPAVFAQLIGELQTLAQSSLHDCLTTNGATWPIANVPTFADDVDPLAIWNSCVVEVQSIVTARQAELNAGQ
jgi:hypothetical protein